MDDGKRIISDGSKKRHCILASIALLEGSTLLFLVGIAVPLKHFAGIPAAVSIAGPIHGAAFLLFLWALLREVVSGELLPKEGLKAFLFAFIPLASFWTFRNLTR